MSERDRFGAPNGFNGFYYPPDEPTVFGESLGWSLICAAGARRKGRGRGMTKLEQAREQHKKAERDYEAAVKEAFPVGCGVRWEDWKACGKYPQEGEVIGHSWTGMVLVRNIGTGKTRKVHEESLTRIGG